MTGQEHMVPGPGATWPDERVRMLGAVRWVFSDADWPVTLPSGMAPAAPAWPG